MAAGAAVRATGACIARLPTRRGAGALGSRFSAFCACKRVVRARCGGNTLRAAAPTTHSRILGFIALTSKLPKGGLAPLGVETAVRAIGLRCVGDF